MSQAGSRHVECRTRMSALMGSVRCRTDRGHLVVRFEQLCGW